MREQVECHASTHYRNADKAVNDKPCIHNSQGHVGFQVPAQVRLQDLPQAGRLPIRPRHLPVAFKKLDDQDGRPEDTGRHWNDESLAFPMSYRDVSTHLVCVCDVRYACDPSDGLRCDLLSPAMPVVPYLQDHVNASSDVPYGNHQWSIINWTNPAGSTEIIPASL